MSFGLLDDEFYINDKIVAFTDAEFRLYVCAISYSRKKRTQGFVSAAAAADIARLHRIRNPRQVIARLEKRPAWIPTEGGWRIHGWEDMPYSRISEVGRKGGVASGLARANGGSIPFERSLNDLGSEHEPRARTPSPAPSPTPIPSSNEDTVTVLEKLRQQVFSLWASRQEWTTWNGHDEEAKRITVWLKARPYPLPFWQWVLPQIPSDVRSFAYLTSPSQPGYCAWVEERYGEWRDGEYLLEKLERAAAPPVVLFMPRAMP